MEIIAVREEYGLQDGDEARLELVLLERSHLWPHLLSDVQYWR